MTNVIELVSLWSVLSTNWVTGHSSTTLMLPAEANIVTYYETGTVTSNRYATILLDKRSHNVLLSSEPFQVGFLQRSYVMTKPEKKYSP